MTIPQLPGFDQTLAFLREGYGFISSRCDRLATDAFHTRLMLRRATCLRGEEAAALFYHPGRFTRRNGAMPPTTMRLLQDKGSVQSMDGAAHRQRKALFTALLMSDAAEESFLRLFRAEWLAALQGWRERPRIVLHDEVNQVLTRAICRWLGVPLARTEELTSMIENAGSVGPAVLAALLRRRRTEGWLRRVVDEARSGKRDVPQEAPLRRLLEHRDADGQLLSTEAAVVEILNILRPVVAIGRYIMFLAMALHAHPEWRAKLSGAGDEDYQRFAEEVRRLYPFFPLIAGTVRAPFRWQGHDFGSGDWVLLDLYGTMHDARLFPDPARFDPGRDLDWRRFDDRFIPQGAGDPHETHRCPGERLTVATMREAGRLLVEAMVYDVPPQDLALPLNRMPARPASNLILANIRAAGA